MVLFYTFPWGYKCPVVPFLNQVPILHCQFKGPLKLCFLDKTGGKKTVKFDRDLSMFTLVAPQKFCWLYISVPGG